jgi:hypothetical protein
MIYSLLCTRSALQRYALDPNAKFTIKADKDGETSNLDNDIIKLLLGREFWQDVETVFQILQPVHEVQKMSESCKSHLGHVLARWDSIRIQWQTMRDSGQYSQIDAIFSSNENFVWTQWYIKQQTDLTWLAWILDPDNDNCSIINTGYIDNMLNLLKKYTSSEKHIEIVEDFFAFRDYKGKFARWHDC